MTDLIKKLREDPYNFIRDYYEGVYMHMGREVFSTLSLVIPSLILPPIPHQKSRSIKSSINFLLIGTPGSGKSSICETFTKLAYNSFPFEYITDAKLYEVVSEKDFVSIVVSDVFKIFSNKLLTKTMENILGDEQKLSRMTKRTDSKEKKIKAVAFLAGTTNCLNSVITDGMIFRTAICIIIHNEEEHKKVGEFINNGSFKERETNEEESAIQEYYQSLLNIQRGLNPEIPKIKGYIVGEKFKERIMRAWEPLVEPMNKRTKFAFFRELHQCYRYMVSHAFLNIYNRKVENDKIIIQEEDLEVAIHLMVKELKTKFEVLSSSRVVDEQKLKTTKELADYLEKQKKNNLKIKDSAARIMESLIKAK